jgi:hypothetical protein
MIDQEAVTVDIVEAKQLREVQNAKILQQEEDRTDLQRRTIVSWLGLPTSQSHHDTSERLLRDCLPHSCDWVSKLEAIQAWCEDSKKAPVVWLHGKPGAGKSSICACLLDLLEDRKTPALFYYCGYRQSDTASTVLKTLVLQLIERNPDLAAVAYAKYITQNLTPSLKVLRAMLVGSSANPGLLHGASPCRIIIDGVDECQESEHGYIVEELLQLVSVNPSTFNCKLLVCSRDVLSISQPLKRAKNHLEIDLTRQHDGVSSAIQLFVEAKLRDLEQVNSSLLVGSEVLETLSQLMADKANGIIQSSDDTVTELG